MREFLSDCAKNIPPSGIRKFFDLASGRPDIVSLGVGEPDFITPWNIRDCAVTAIKKGYTQYTSNKGLKELRDEISLYLKERFSVSFSAENIVVTLGASEGIDVSLRAVINAGEEVLIPDPSYVSYSPLVSLIGGKPVAVGTSAKNGFKITAEAIEKAVTDKTKAIILSYPNNPTGAIMDKEDIKKIIPVILKHDLLIISDEIYGELTYGKRHCSVASFKELEGRVLLISGFSKSFAMTGWRIGYVCAPEKICKAILKIHQYVAICAPIFSQYGALEGLRQGREDGYKDVEDMKKEYDKRRRFMIGEFNRMGLKCFQPEGSFYVFPCVESTGMDGETFATRLIEDGKVAVVPGNAFGDFGKNFIRCSYAYSMENLKYATGKIAEFVSSLKK